MANLVIAASGFLLIPIIAKLLGPEGYGVWVQVTITLNLLSMVTSLGLASTLVRFFAAETDRHRIQGGFYTILFTMLLVRAGVAVIMLIAAPWLAGQFFGGGEAVGIVRLTAVMLPVYGMETLLLFFFRTFRQMKVYFVAVTLSHLVELSLVLMFILLGKGIFGAVLGLFAARVLTGLALLTFITARLGFRMPSRGDIAGLAGYLRYGLPLIPPNLSLWVTNFSDRYVIVLFLGIGATGIYGATYGLVRVIRMVLTPLNFVLVPALSQHYDQGELKEVRSLLSHSFKYLMLLCVPAAVGMSMLARPILRVLTTQEFVAEGAPLIPVLAASVLALAWYTIFAQVIHLVKKTAILGTIWTVAAVLNLGLNLIVVPWLGIMGAALTTLLAFGGAAAYITVVSRRYVKFTIPWVALAKALIASGVMAVAISRADIKGAVGLLLTIVVGAAIYFATLFLLRAFTPGERRFFQELVRRWLSGGVSVEPGVAGGPAPDEGGPKP